VLAQDEGGHDQDENRLDGPDQHRHAGGDRGQADQAQGVGRSGVEDAECGQLADWRGDRDRLSPDCGDDEQQNAAGRELDR
jgi:hypothetical protein